MSETNCRIAGCTPVLLGMRLLLRFWPSQTPDDMWVNHAAFTGAKGGKPELSARHMLWGG